MVTAQSTGGERDASFGSTCVCTSFTNLQSTCTANADGLHAADRGGVLELNGQPAMKSAFMMRFSRTPMLTLAALAMALAIAPARADNEALTIPLDQATLVKMPERLATLVIGNPLVADVSVQTGGLLVVTGKGYGSTNLVALDKDGAVLLEKTVNVVAPRENLMTVYKGVDRETYSCAPNCQPRVTLGDAPKFFNPVIGQGSVRNAQAQAQSQSQR